MNTYKVFRNMRGLGATEIYKHITTFEHANELATALQAKTGDTCYVVEYQNRSHRPHRTRRTRVV